MGRLNSEVHKSEIVDVGMPKRKKKEAKMTVSSGPNRHRKLVDPEANIIGNVY